MSWSRTGVDAHGLLFTTAIDPRRRLRPRDACMQRNGSRRLPLRCSPLGALHATCAAQSGSDAGDRPWRIGELAMLCVTTPATEPRLTPAARVTSAILEALKRGVRPWTRPWSPDTSISLPLRANGLPYKGVNTIALWAAALEHGYASPYWLTSSRHKRSKPAIAA